MSTQPLLSVVTVSLEESDRLSRTLRSMLGIDSRLEHITVAPIQDSISSNTWESALVGHHPNFHLHFDTGSGLYEAMNLGASVATGRYLVFWNAGDTLTELESLYEALVDLESSPNSWLICQGYASWADLSNTSLQTLADFILGKKAAFISHPTIIVRRDTFLQLGGFNSNYKVAADTDLTYRLYDMNDPVILSQILVTVDAPIFASKHQRRARVENLLIKSRNLRGLPRAQTLLRVIVNEMTYLIRTRWFVK